MSDIVFAHVIICRGSSCGAYPLNTDEIQTRWREQGLWRHIALSFSECLTTCDQAPTICIMSAASVEWLTQLNLQEALQALYEWADRIGTEKKFIPLPPSLSKYRTPHLI